VWQPNLSLLNGIFDVWGIHNPLILADYHRYWEGLGSRSSRLYDFLNAKYVIAHKDVTLDWDKFQLVFDGDPQVNLYRNTMVLPRALLVHNSWSVADQEAAFAAVHEPTFDPATTAVIEHGTELRSDQAIVSEADITSYTNNEIAVQTSASMPGYLVLSEVYYPGWKAQVDSQPAEVKRANFAFRAVYVSSGTHEVRLYFQPGTWQAGLVCTAITWAVLIVLGLTLVVRRGRVIARGGTN